MIYFMQIGAGDEALIKIGYAEDVKDRAWGVQCTRGKKVIVLGVMDGARPEEAVLHGMFRHLREGRHEHFRPEPDLIEYIEENAFPFEDTGRRRKLPKRDDQTVKLDRMLVGRATLVAVYRGISVAELLSTLLVEPLERAMEETIAELKVMAEEATETPK